jgi:hypothetical protein
MHIIRDTSGVTYRVAPHPDAAYAHLFLGVAVKRVRGEWVDRKGARTELVRRAATETVEVV